MYKDKSLSSLVKMFKDSQLMFYPLLKTLSLDTQNRPVFELYSVLFHHGIFVCFFGFIKQRIYLRIQNLVSWIISQVKLFV